MRVIVTRLLPPAAQRKLKEWAASENIKLFQWPHYETAIPRQLLLDQCRSTTPTTEGSIDGGVDGILCLLSDRIDNELLTTAGTRLRVISTVSVGVDHIDTTHPVFHNRTAPVRLGYTPDVLTDDCADLCVALVLALGRRLVEATDVVRKQEWPASFSPVWMLGNRLVRDKTIGVYGMGRIGRAVCQRLLAFRPRRILYCRSGQSAGTDSSGDPADRMLLDQSRLAGWGLEEVRRVPFQELLAESDLILITASLNPHTRNAFNEQAFKQMRSTAVLVNVARGPIVNTDDLQTALLSGAIGGAALDVCDPEPLDCERYAQLLNMPDRCLITPHISSATVETREEMAALALDNLICGLQGHPLPQSYF